MRWGGAAIRERAYRGAVDTNVANGQGGKGRPRDRGREGLEGN